MTSFILFLLFHKSLKKIIYYFCKKKKPNTNSRIKKVFSMHGTALPPKKKTQANKQKHTLKMYKKLQIKRGKQRLPPANHCRCSAWASHLTLLTLPGHALFSSQLWMRKPRPGEVRWLFWHCWVTEDTAGIKPSRLTLEPGTLRNSTCDSREGKCRLNRKQHCHL